MAEDRVVTLRFQEGKAVDRELDLLLYKISSRSDVTESKSGIVNTKMGRKLKLYS